MLEYEATHRAALLLALDQWARRQAGTLGDEPRDRARQPPGLLASALAPLQGEMSRANV